MEEESEEKSVGIGMVEPGERDPGVGTNTSLEHPL